MSEIRFDDLSALKAMIGTEFGPWSKQIEVTQEMINRFADVTGDHQWIHIDVERAKRESPFGGPVAHGFLTLSLLPQLGNDLGFQIVGNRAGINYGANKLRFVSPVPSGAKVHAHSRLVRGRQETTRYAAYDGNQYSHRWQRKTLPDLRTDFRSCRIARS